MRRFDFDGDDAQYISFLEDIVHNAGLLQPATLPPSTEEHTHPAYESSRNRRQHTTPTSKDEKTTVPQFQIIEYNPSETKSKPPRHNKERWQKEIDCLLSLANIKILNSKAQEIGLGDNQIVISGLVSGFNVSDYCPDADSISLPVSEFLLSLRKYALFTKKCNNEARLLSCLARFQDLIFVSFCVVALGLGEAKDCVHEAMKLYISNSEGQHLDRIISGARWVNRCITELSKTAWSLRSPEIFLLGEQTINFYGRYAEAGSQSTPYFLNSLQELAKGFSDAEQTTRIPISIPCIVKLLSGPAIELSAICDILGYDQSLTMDLFRRHYDSKFTFLNSQQSPSSLLKHRDDTDCPLNHREAKRRAHTNYSGWHISNTAHDMVRTPQSGPTVQRRSSEQIYTDRNDSTPSSEIDTGDGCSDPDMFRRVPTAPPDFNIFQFDSSQNQLDIPPEFDVFQFGYPSAQLCFPPEFNIFQLNTPSTRFSTPSMFSAVQSDPLSGQSNAQTDGFQFDEFQETNNEAANISRGLNLEGQNVVGSSLPFDTQV
ncbi:hypothetical protein AFLA70_265g001371 [Aspergillus flavus AF70]|nr:hypothetical protein AFLA70_265g001371 [Aspergillus flavus AF70]